VNVQKKLKIAMLGQKRLSHEGGIEIVVKELSTRMVLKGHEVTLYNRSGHHVSGNAFDGMLTGNEYKGVKIKLVPTIDKKGLAAITSSFFSSLFAAFGKYDIIHIHAEGPAAFCWLLKLFGKRVVVTIHGLDWQREKWQGTFASKYIHFGEKMAVCWADEIIVLSKGVQKYFKDMYDRKTRFIPNGVNKEKKAEARKITDKFGLKKDEYVLYLGRIVPEKGGHYLIKAWKMVNSDKRLVIAGGTSDTDKYMDMLGKLAENDDRIIFTGFVHGSMLAELYSNSYIYIIPSDLEGMPLSLLEAMSYGNCCLVSDIDECASVIGNNGVVFRKADVYDLREKLQMLIDKPMLVKKYKQMASGYITEKYNWDKTVKKTLELYRKDMD